MANILADPGGDQFMPEYWPANKLVGKLENVLLEAQNIIGLIKSGQIEGLNATKIIGKLTNEQLEEIAAAKISGQLTNAQIESLEAAKLLGQIKEVQIAEGAITANKIAANAVTASKILAESITASKIAAATITGAKLAAGTITAEKLAVEKLSAISANLGTVTAGNIEAVDIKLLESENEVKYPEVSKIDWMQAGVIHSWIGAFGSAGLSRIKVVANDESHKTEGQVELEAIDKNKNHAQLFVSSFNTGSQILAKTLWSATEKELKEAHQVLIFDSSQRSNFPQMYNAQKTVMYWGYVAANGTIGNAGSGGWNVVHTGTGIYTISFAQAMSLVPTVTGADIQGTRRTFCYGVINGETIQVQMSSPSFTLEDIAFSFIAIG